MGPTDRHPTRLGGEIGGEGARVTVDTGRVQALGRKNQRAAEVEPGIRHGEDGGAVKEGGSLVGNGATGGADEKIFAGEEQLRLRTAKRRDSGERKRAIGRTEGRQKGEEEGKRKRERGRREDSGGAKRKRGKSGGRKTKTLSPPQLPTCTLHSTLHNDSLSTPQCIFQTSLMYIIIA